MSEDKQRKESDQVKENGGKRKSKGSNEGEGIYKKQRKHQDVLVTANKIWNGKLKSVTKDEKSVRVERVMKTIQGLIAEIAMKHDGARVVQICIKYGTPEQKLAVAEELKGSYNELCKSGYGHHVVLKLLAYGDSDIENLIYEELKSECKNLAVHSHGCKIVDYLWRQVCKPSQKDEMVLPFYGKRFQILESGKTLEDAFARDTTGKLQKMVVTILSEFLQRALDKELLGMGIVHRLLVDFLTFAEDSQIDSMIESDLRNHSLQLLQTEDGALVVLEMLIRSKAKERKAILKSLKGHVAEVCCDPHGWIALVAALSIVDDTVLLKKTIISEMEEGMESILYSPNASKLFVFLLFGGNSKGLSASDKHNLNRLKNNKNSKKDPLAQRAEVMEMLVPCMLKSFTSTCAELIDTISHRDLSRVLVGTVREASTILSTSSESIQDEYVNLINKIFSNVIELCAQDLSLLSHSIVHRSIKDLLVASACLFPEFCESSHLVDFPSELCKLLPANSESFTARSGWILAAILENKLVSSGQVSLYLKAAHKAAKENGQVGCLKVLCGSEE